MSDIDESPVRKVFSKLTKLKTDSQRFWRTRQAVLGGEALWSLDKTRLGESQFMLPWTFNAFQSIVAGASAAILGKLLRAIYPGDFEGRPAFFADDPELAAAFAGAFEWTEPFVLPVFLTANVFLMAWGSLKGPDSNPVSRARARSAYLYFDGAYGLWPQLALALLTVDISFFIRRQGLLEFVLTVAIFWLWQTVLSADKIPRLMFAANGYSTRARRLWQPRRSDDPPWERLAMASLLSGIPVLAAVWSVAFLFAYVCAWLVKLLHAL